MQLSNIIQMDKLLNINEISSFFDILSRPVVTELVREEVDLYRNKIIQRNEAANTDDLLQNIIHALENLSIRRIQPLINATGVIVHTNFGRSPFPLAAWRDAEEIVCRYSNLELSLVNGKRGNRMGMLSKILSAYFGGESNILVNNNAAAIHLILKTFAQGKEVIVSRSEQVQIGGGFRIPEILEESGAILRDVGTTNITTLDDYLRAVNENTAMVLIVHQSNYYIEGFTQRVEAKALASRLPSHVMLVIDQGSGNQIANVPGEPTVSHYLKADADLVCFSGDKMLGGPQSGIILGKKDYIDKLSKHPMMRVFRPGKETYALIEKILVHRLNRDGQTENRIEELINQPLSWHEARAQRLVNVAPDKLQLMPSKFLIGGGTTPRAQYDTWVVALNTQLSANVILKRLRTHSPSIMGVVQQNKVLLYPVTLFDDEMEVVEKFLEVLTSEADF